MLGLLRSRRSRMPIALTIFLVIVLYHFFSLRDDSTAAVGIDSFKEHANSNPPPPVAPPSLQEPITPPDVAQPPKPADDKPAERPPVEETNVIPLKPVIETARPSHKSPKPDVEEDDKIGKPLDGDVEKTPVLKPSASIAANASRVVPVGHDHQEPLEVVPTAVPHWEKTPEHFPVAQEDIIPLPTGAPKEIPLIQASFATENEADKKVRLERRAAVKEAFKHAWSGYKTYAYQHDELMPASGLFKDPFGGWRATLVDTLDTLWIMDLTEEFEEAVDEVATLDFTKSVLPRIPLFETVIRYLGGIVAAYDISGMKYDKLLRKAVELADILTMAFDTPNRMPLLHYPWKPEEAAEIRRAATKSCMAELGSLSLEFTRLAQITGNSTYFDLIQRITDALDEFQPITTVPGLWANDIDASGCRVEQKPKVKPNSAPVAQAIDWDLDAKSKKAPVKSPQNSEPTTPGIEEKVLPVSNQIGGSGKEVSLETTEKPVTPGIEEKILPVSNQIGGSGKEVFLEDETSSQPAVVVKPTGEDPAEKKYDMTPKVGGSGKEVFPDKSLRSRAVDAAGVPVGVVKPNTPTAAATPTCTPQGISRAPGDRSEKYSLGAKADSTYEYLPKQYLLLGGVPEAEQYRRMYEYAVDVATDQLLFRPRVIGDPDILFAGDLMVYDNSDDSVLKLAPKFVPIGSHLACFAGGMYAMGGRIFERPSDVSIGAKLTNGCVWAYQIQNSGIMSETFRTNFCPDWDNCTFSEEDWVMSLAPSEEDFQKSRKYLLDIAEGQQREAAKQRAKAEFAKEDAEAAAKTKMDGGGARMRRSPPKKPVVSEEDLAMTRADYGRKLIDKEGLPPGFIAMNDRRYILRPEAIESVWYMYRITGQTSWMDKGWKMFEAVEKATKTEFGYSAIPDVTWLREDPEFRMSDSMESFWLAETLKYYYLLFSEPELVSLDEWVLNTEAHPFKRPQAESEAVTKTASGGKELYA